MPSSQSFDFFFRCFRRLLVGAAATRFLCWRKLTLPRHVYEDGSIEMTESPTLPPQPSPFGEQADMVSSGANDADGASSAHTSRV